MPALGPGQRRPRKRRNIGALLPGGHEPGPVGFNSDAAGRIGSAPRVVSPEYVRTLVMGAGSVVRVDGDTSAKAGGDARLAARCTRTVCATAAFHQIQDASKPTAVVT